MADTAGGLRRRLIPIFSVVGVIAVLGALAVSSTQPPARVQIAHLSPNAPALDIYINGVLAESGMNFQSVGGVNQVETDGYRETLIEVRPAGVAKETYPVLASGVILGPGDHYVLVVTNIYAGLQTAAIRIPAENILYGRGRVQVFHSMPDGPRVDVYNGNDVVVPALGYVEPPLAFELVTGGYRLDAFDAGSRALLFQQNLSVEAGKVYTVFVSGPPVKALVVVTSPGGDSVVLP